MPARAKSPKSDDIVVFKVVRDTECAECGEELWSGRLLRMEDERPLCMTCADLDHLTFLPSGDAALTRRATKYSALRAVVVRFSRSRGRYERQGILVEQQAIERAEAECLADAAARAVQRERASERRERLDAEYVSSFSERLEELYPGCSPAERRAIAEHACVVHSGRVGRTAAAKALDSRALGLAVRAHVRHAYTNYDSLLAAGVPREEARMRVGDEVEQRLTDWRGRP